MVGVVSQTNLVHALTTACSSGRVGRDSWSRDLMSVPAVTVHAGTLLDEAARVMEANRIHRLIVTGAEAVSRSAS